MKRTYSIPLQFPIPYRFRRAYLQSAINVIYRKGFLFNGFTATLSGNIPQNAGLSSSSALTVAWIAFLARLVGKKLKSEEIAEWAYEAEVLEFNEPGGKQDQYATSLGNLNYMEFSYNNPPSCTPLNQDLLSDIAIIIGNSQVKKRTLNTVYRIKQRTLHAIQELQIHDLNTIQLSDIPKHSSYQTLKAILKIRDITLKGKDLFSSQIKGKEIGKYLSEQHVILRDELELSHPRIESMINGALNNGAYGAKITGTGEGGCMVVLCAPDDVEHVMEGISKGTGKPYHVKIDSGVKVNVFGSQQAYEQAQTVR